MAIIHEPGPGGKGGTTIDAGPSRIEGSPLLVN